jgi:hypothetical protein
VQAVRQGTCNSIQEFTDDLRNILQTVWRNVEGLNPQEDTYSKLAIYQSLFAVPFDLNVRTTSSFAETFASGSDSTCLAKCQLFQAEGVYDPQDGASWEHDNSL